MIVTRCAAVLCTALATAGCATAPPGTGQRDAQGSPLLERISPQEAARLKPNGPARLTRATIVGMTRRGASPEEIIDLYYATGSRLRLTGEQLADLGRDGVAPAVLDFIASHEEDARRIDADTAQADRDGRDRAQWEAYRYRGWRAYSGAPYWESRVYPYAGYAWHPRGNGWYGGVGIGF